MRAASPRHLFGAEDVMRCAPALLLVPLFGPAAFGDDRPKPISGKTVAAWESEAGAQCDRSAALRLVGPPASDPFEAKAAKMPGELPAYVVDYKYLSRAEMGLAALSKLRNLHVTKSNLDAAQVTRLRNAMPECKITWRFRD